MLAFLTAQGLGRVRAPRAALACFALSLFTSLAGCSRTAAVPADRPNLLLITVDTLRADHLGLYGYPRPTSPRLDDFARASVVFERAYATSSWTLPSLASLMSAQLPATHACLGNEARLADGIDTLGERLSAAGYWSAAITSHVFLARKYGLAQGFDVYDDSLVLETLEASHNAVSSPRVSERGIEWLRERAATPDEPWFIWLHYFDPHNVYVPHAEYRETFGRTTDVDRYDTEIAFTDAHIGSVLDELESLGLSDRTLVVLTADHGEEFQDHGGTGHRRTLYEEVIRVPLVVRAPDVAPRRVAEPVSLVDVMPTCLQLLDLSPPARIEGRSLVPALRGETIEPRALMSELGRNNLDALVHGDWKLVREARTDSEWLFDLATDPGETRDRSTDEPRRVGAMRRELRAIEAAAREKGRALGAGGRVELTERERVTLTGLGYAGDR